MDITLFVSVGCSLIVICAVVYIILQLIADLRWQRNNQPSLIIDKRAKKKTKDSSKNIGKLSLSRANLTNSELKLAKAGVPITAKNWNLGMLVIAALLLFVCIIIGNVLIGLAFAAAVPFVARFYLDTQIKKRNLLFEKQLNEAELQMAENLRSGLTVARSIRTVSEQADEPLKGEFERVYTEMTYSNLSLPEALQRMADRTGQRDVELLATVLQVQEETGSDLSESLEYLAETLSKRLEMRNAIKVELAQIRMTIKIVAAAPPAILVFTLFFYNGYMDFYTQPLGIMILVVCAVIEVLGLIVLNKIADVKFE